MKKNSYHKRVYSNKIPKSISQKKLLTPKIKECKMTENNNTNINNINEIDIKMLLENENDTYENLRVKNSKLRILIIQASNKITEITNKYNKMEINYQEEKKEILKQLDKISVNYKIYAESFQQNFKIKNDFNNLSQKYEQNLKVISNYQKDIIYLLSEYIQMHFNISNFLNNYYNSNLNNIRVDSINFIEKNKEFIEKNMMKFNKKIDTVNFPDFYNEYNSFLERIKIQKRIGEEENKIKNKKTYSIRKKEYINNSNIIINNNNNNIINSNIKPNNITYSNNYNGYLNKSEINYGKENKKNYDFYNDDNQLNKTMKNKSHFKRELLFNKKNTFRNISNNDIENVDIPINQNNSCD